MYKEKKFRVRPDRGDPGGHRHGPRPITGPDVQRVFLMDGDAIVDRGRRSCSSILEKLYDCLPSLLEKVTAYAGPRSTLSKTPEELKRPPRGRAVPGLSGGGERQRRGAAVHPQGGAPPRQMLQAGQRLVEAGIDLWVTIILGITGEGGDWRGARPVHRPASSTK